MICYYVVDFLWKQEIWEYFECDNRWLQFLIGDMIYFAALSNLLLLGCMLVISETFLVWFALIFFVVFGIKTRLYIVKFEGVIVTYFRACSIDLLLCY